MPSGMTRGTCGNWWARLLNLAALGPYPLHDACIPTITYTFHMKYSSLPVQCMPEFDEQYVLVALAMKGLRCDFSGGALMF